MCAYHANEGDNREKLDFYFDNAPLTRFGGYYFEFRGEGPGVVEYMTESLCACLGYTQDEVMGMLHGEITRFVYPPDLEAYRQFVFDVADSLDTKFHIYRMNRKDGSFIYVMDTLRAIEIDGRVIVFSAVVDIDEYRVQNMQEQISHCVKIFSNSYDLILFLDSRRQVFQLLYGDFRATADGPVQISLSMEETVKRWISITAAEDEQKRLLEFLSPVLGHPSGIREALEPSRMISFANPTIDEDGERGTSEIALLYMGGGVSLLCHRDITAQVLAQRHQELNASMKRAQGYYRGLIEFLVDGLLAYHERDDGNYDIVLCERAASTYFNLPEFELESGNIVTINPNAFVEQSALTRQEFNDLLRTGSVDLGSAEGVSPRGYARLIEAFDVKTRLHWISVTRLEKTHGGKKIKIEDIRPSLNRSDVYIRTFGHFEVFVNGSPIPFRHEKSKELLALLVDRRGGYVTSRDAIGYLWENEPANKVTLARFRKVAMRLRNILEEHGIADIVEMSQRNRRINTDKVRCDLFDYLWGGPDYAQTFKGSYLTDYSWGEFTMMELMSNRPDSEYEEDF